MLAAVKRTVSTSLSVYEHKNTWPWHPLLGNFPHTERHNWQTDSNLYNQIVQILPPTVGWLVGLVFFHSFCSPLTFCHSIFFCNSIFGWHLMVKPLKTNALGSLTHLHLHVSFVPAVRNAFPCRYYVLSLFPAADFSFCSATRCRVGNFYLPLH